jgi:small subunit ribosomal protein S6
MNYYEKIFILDPNIDDSAVEEITVRIKDVITNNGGEILKTDNWGRRKLAYELNKHQKGNYTLILFKSPPQVILELEKLCKILDSVIKFMIVKLTKKKEIEASLPSPAEKAVKPETTEPAAAEPTAEVAEEAAPVEEK